MEAALTLHGLNRIIPFGVDSEVSLESISPTVAQAIVAAWEKDFRERTKFQPWKRFRWGELRQFTPRDWGGLILFAASMGLTNQACKDQLTALKTSYDAGTAAVIQFYTTARATDTDTAIGAQTLLGTCTMSSTSFGSPAGSSGADATITASTITDDSSADATGTVVWCRISTQSGGTAISDHNCGTSSSDFVFNTTAWTSGSTISVSSFVITQPHV